MDEDRDYQETMKQHYDPIIPGEDKLLISLVKSILHEHNNKVEWNYGTLEFVGSPTLMGKTIVFTTRNNMIQIGMKFPLESSVSALQSQLMGVSLKLPLPGFESPANWEIYPQTSFSTFKGGVTFNSYDTTTHTLSITINTSFFRIYGSMIRRRPYSGVSPKGTCFQIRQPVEGHVELLAHLNVN